MILFHVLFVKEIYAIFMGFKNLAGIDSSLLMLRKKNLQDAWFYAAWFYTAWFYVVQIFIL
jgi:hypothetical protein